MVRTVPGNLPQVRSQRTTSLTSAMNDFALRACRHGDLDRLLTVEEASIEDGPYSRFVFIYNPGRARDGF